MARKTAEVDAGSMADISFLMLIFFLVTTTMDVDTGIIRQLSPPPPEDQEIPDIKERNIMKILINSHDMLMVNGKGMDVRRLKDEMKDFMSIHPDNAAYPEITFKEVELLGNVPTTKGIISLKNDRGTSYEMYIKVQDQIAITFKELRDELSMQKFGKHYDKLIDEDIISAINKAVPIRVSEAEPAEVGEN